MCGTPYGYCRNCKVYNEAVISSGFWRAVSPNNVGLQVGSNGLGDNAFQHLDACPLFGQCGVPSFVCMNATRLWKFPKRT